MSPSPATCTRRACLSFVAALRAPAVVCADTRWLMEKPMTIVVPWPAGSSFDFVAA